jgi:hypothetical protein
MEDTNCFIRKVTLLHSLFIAEAAAEEHNEDETNHHLGNGGMHGSKCVINKITKGKSKMKALAEQKNKVKYGQSFLKSRIGFLLVSRRPEKL